MKKIKIFLILVTIFILLAVLVINQNNLEPTLILDRVDENSVAESKIDFIERVNKLTNNSKIILLGNKQNKIKEKIIYGYPFGESCWDKLNIQAFEPGETFYDREFYIDPSHQIEGNITFQVKKDDTIYDPSSLESKSLNLLNWHVSRSINIYKVSNTSRTKTLVNDVPILLDYCGSNVNIRSFNESLITVSFAANQFAEGGYAPGVEIPTLIFFNGLRFESITDLILTKLKVEKDSYNSWYVNTPIFTLIEFDKNILHFGEIHNAGALNQNLIEGFRSNIFVSTADLSILKIVLTPIQY